MNGRDRICIAVVLSVILAGVGAEACSSASGGGRAPPPARTGIVVPVTKVTDGDTIHVTYEGKDERVRLIGVDTPEVSWYGGTAECFGEEAGLYTRERLSGRAVGLVFDVERRDRYDRLLAYVYVGTELFNLTLVTEGYATADPVAPDTRMADALAGAERAARAAGRGLWSACPAPAS